MQWMYMHGSGNTVKEVNMECVNCCYYWKEDWEDRPSCHWTSRCPDDKAPCEYDDTDYVNEMEDYYE